MGSSMQGIKVWLLNQCVTFLNAFIVLRTSTGTDWSAECGEQIINWEAHCREQQVEGVGQQESGTIVSLILRAEPHNVSYPDWRLPGKGEKATKLLMPEPQHKQKQIKI